METLKKSFIVTEETLAVRVGSGSLRVLATPVVAAWMENAAAELAQRFVEPGSTTVGCSITVKHDAPTPLGSGVEVTAVLEKTEGRFFQFSLEAKDAEGVVARGTHERVVVQSSRFQQKADSRRKA